MCLRFKNFPWKYLFAVLYVSSLTIIEIGCSHNKDIKPPDPVEENIKKTLAVGPFDTKKLTYEDQQVGGEFEKAIQKSVLNRFNHMQIFKNVILLNTDGLPEEARSVEGEAIRLAAKDQGADFILVGEVEKFNAKAEGMIFSEHEVNVKLGVKLYNVLDGTPLWSSSDVINARSEDSIDSMLNSIVVDSGTIGLVDPLVVYIRENCRYFDPDCQRDSFGEVERAIIDEELKPPEIDITPKPHAFAVVIGIEEYLNYISVDYASRDAHAMKGYLSKTMGYPEENVMLLENTYATRSRITAIIESWLPKKIGKYNDAEVFVYYGGHGSYEAEKAYLVPYDGDLSFLKETTYSLDRLYDQLGKLPAMQVTLVIDSCFSGGIGGRSVVPEGSRQNEPLKKLPDPPSPNLKIFTASDSHEISFYFRQKQHGLFTYYWMKGLQGNADADNNGKVTYQEQHEYVRSMVAKEAMRLQNREQNTQFKTKKAEEATHDTLVEVRR